ncbi:hypothetical protein J6590_005904 [Homalodisca vitripennis]|nr:hypothetical protein J6590_005904 [Homalodisca vitripennis]
MLRRCAEGEAGLFLSPPNHVNVGCQPSGHFHALSLSFTGRARHANFSSRLRTDVLSKVKVSQGHVRGTAGYCPKYGPIGIFISKVQTRLAALMPHVEGGRANECEDRGNIVSVQSVVNVHIDMIDIDVSRQRGVIAPGQGRSVIVSPGNDLRQKHPRSLTKRFVLLFISATTPKHTEVRLPPGCLRKRLCGGCCGFSRKLNFRSFIPILKRRYYLFLAGTWKY